MCCTFKGLPSECKTVSSALHPAASIFSAKSPPAIYARISTRRLTCCHSATWFFLTSQAMWASCLKDPDRSLKESLREAYPDPLALSLWLFGCPSPALLHGRPCYAPLPHFFGSPRPPFRAGWQVPASAVLSKEYIVWEGNSKSCDATVAISISECSSFTSSMSTDGKTDRLFLSSEAYSPLWLESFSKGIFVDIVRHRPASCRDIFHRDFQVLCWMNW